MAAPSAVQRTAPAEHIAVRCVDSDVHPVPRSGELTQYIPEPWRSKYFLSRPVGEQTGVGHLRWRPTSDDGHQQQHDRGGRQHSDEAEARVDPPPVRAWCWRRLGRMLAVGERSTADWAE